VAHPPSGEQVELVFGDQRAIVVEVGGGLRAYSAGDWGVLDGFREDEMAGAGRGQPLLPWPNRLRDGRYRFAGRDLQLALTEPARNNAIHGLVRWANWFVAERSDRHAVMEHLLHPHPGYPFTLRLSLRYALAPDGLTVTIGAVNEGGEPCPFGAGMHPYVSVGTETLDDAELLVPAARRLISDDRGIPVGSEPVAGTDCDFRVGRRIGDTRLDTDYAGLDRDADGRARVWLASPESGRRVAVWQDERFDHLMVFTGDTLPEDRRRRSIAVEPMSCPPNAFASGDGLLVLEPGEAFSGSWGIAPDRAP
jgi:aldose 1-epimerase